MAPSTPPSSAVTPPARDATDESLATERERADVALADGGAEVAKEAQRVLDRARVVADEVLAAERVTADRVKSPGTPSGQTDANVAAERAAADQRLEHEREAADQVRRTRARASHFARLLPLEREKTDQLLETERARADGALATRDDFLGMVSHDLRDLLNGVAGNAQLLAAGAESDNNEKTKLLAARILRSSTRMNRLIGDLVDVASIDAGKLAVARAPTDLAEILREAAETWSPTANAKGVTLDASAEASIVANVDAERILQVLGNLVTNAVKFSERGGVVSVRVTSEGGEARFVVRDTGIGIDASLLDAVFERFWQVAGNNRRGLGLGLFISKCLVEAHSGRIWAESVVGEGSAFVFVVPLG